MRLNNKVFLIGGVGPGMGQATAKLFAQEGAAVALVARKGDYIERYSEEINAYGGKSIAIVADLTKPDEVKRVFTMTVNNFGSISGYCSFPGGNYKHLKNIELIEDDFFDRVLYNHIKSTFWSVREVIPYLKKLGGGTILTTAAGYKTRRNGNIAYGTAKEAIIGFTKNLAREMFEYNIRVNCICPGLIRIPLEGKVTVPTQSIDRLGQPQDIAYAALFLSSDEAPWITGQTLSIDGGDEVYVREPYDLR